MNQSSSKTSSQLLSNLLVQLEKAVIGKPETLRLTVISLLCRGHLLLEDVPGLGKTTLAKALASSLALTFKRIQCTPDLLPADITGVSIFDQKAQNFRFLPGPVFANILLADEINRTSPRTQSALLEAMAERTVTVDRKTRSLPSSFMVIATQNPVEFSGTYPLPEAQLDRFFMRVSLGYPSLADEANIMFMNQQGDPITSISAVLTEAQLQQLQMKVTQVRLNTKVVEYIAALVQATREHPKIRLGASPRGSIALMKAIQAQALLSGSQFVTPQMVHDLIKPVLLHRLLLRSGGDDAAEILDEILANIPVPSMPQAATDQSESGFRENQALLLKPK